MAKTIVQPAVDLELDHLLYITSRPYRRTKGAAFHRWRRRHSEGLFRWTVLHEADLSCCLREPWATTFTKLIQALNDDGLAALGVIA